MLSTRVGYAGGDLPDPTYHDLGNHTEAVEVTFDPRRISYRQLLDVFWNSFPASIPPGPSRVRTSVMPRDERQRAAAESSKRHFRQRAGGKIYTEIRTDATFWPAERMHQKFNLQRVHPELVRELAAATDVDTFLASTAATRLNAYLGGFADDEGLAAVAREEGMDFETLRARLRSAD